MGNPNCGACGHMNTRGFCNLTACIFPCPTGMGGYINKPKTNADRIRSMTDEELADFLTGDFCDFCELLCGAPVVCGGQCREKCLEWLKKEVDE